MTHGISPTDEHLIEFLFLTGDIDLTRVTLDNGIFVF